LKNVSEITKPAFDTLSIILSTIGFGGLVFGFGSLGNAGWSNPTVYVSLVVSVISLIWFIMRQIRIDNPMLEMRVLKYPMFSIGATVSVILMMSMYSMMIILPLFLQNGLLLTASITGLILLPGGIINGLLSPIVGRIFDRFGPVFLTISGMATVLLVMILMTQVSLETPPYMFIILHSLFMIGMAVVMTPAQ